MKNKTQESNQLDSVKSQLKNSIGMASRQGYRHQSQVESKRGSVLNRFSRNPMIS